MTNKAMNILFITADQWRGECLSILGHPHVKTPNLDALARDGVLFRNHFAQATPCSPSRSSLHTGMYLQNHRCVINGAPLDNRFSNWAREVSAAAAARYSKRRNADTTVSTSPSVRRL